MSEIDKDYEKIVKQINQKLAKAAAALKEANELREKIGLPGFITGMRILEDLDQDQIEQFYEDLEVINISDLRREIDNAGWSTSSSRC